MAGYLSDNRKVVVYMGCNASGVSHLLDALLGNSAQDNRLSAP